MASNWWMFFVAGLIPLAIGFVWYGNMGFGKKWMNINGFSDEDLEGGNMVLIMGLSYLFSCFIAFTMSGIVVHQTAVFQLMMPEVMVAGSDAQGHFTDLMSQYAGSFRSFKHGALHGVIITIFFVFPLFAINSLFERRGWGYILIHSGYWLVCLALMGGLLCQTLVYAL